MPPAANHPEVHVSVAEIVCDNKVLAVWNPQWGSFTLPMSKLRVWADPDLPGRVRQEEWADAAARAAAEVLGRTCQVASEPTCKDASVQQSDRDGIWKTYHFRLFRVSVDSGAKLVDGMVAEWLTRSEFLEATRRPISNTARYLIRVLEGK